jgi:hypothetical protein
MNLIKILVSLALILFCISIKDDAGVKLDIGKQVTFSDCFQEVDYFDVYNSKCVSKYKNPKTGVLQESEADVCSGLLVPPISNNLELVDTNKYTTMKYGCGDDGEESCEFNAINNVSFYAEEYLWPKVADINGKGFYVRAPCGGATSCYNLLQDRVYCVAVINDCSLTYSNLGGITIGVHVLDCLATKVCRIENLKANECCTEVNEN